MSTTGLSLQGLVPTPAVNENDLDQHDKSFSLVDGDTDSHALATGEQDLKGLAQVNHGAEVVDLGWNEPAEDIPGPLVGGMDNEELWMMVRRFNKQMYHVKETTKPVAGNLDLNIADEDEFSPDKLRSTVERLYTTIGIGLIGFGKHIARLQSWHEKQRTAAFASVYFVAWAFDFLIPTFAILMITLIAYVPSRDFLFPPAPLALVNGKTGGLQKPKAGVLGSHDSATGAPENYKGEAVEQEASNFVNGIANVALSSATGKHPMNDPEDEEGGAAHDAAPDPTAVVTSASAARASAGGQKSKDKTKVPMETAIWNKMRPLMHGLQDAVDTWERFANALSPTRPFPLEAPRLRLAGLVVPVLATGIFVTSYMFTKGVAFGIGFGFFGQPVIKRGIDMLNRYYPDWQKLLEIRNTLLKGIPTNAQLTITLLRIGEANKAPLPPPPQTDNTPPDDPAHMTDDHLASTGADAPLGATPAQIQDAISHDPRTAHEVDGTDIAASKDTKHGKKGSKILGFFKSSVKASVETALGADHLKAKTGSSAAKNRVGVIPSSTAVLVDGPIDFKARYSGKKGLVYISAKATIPCVSFTTDHTVEKIGSQDRTDLHPQWTIAIADIRELKKVGGFGWKAKLVVGWALDREIADGLEITDRRGNTVKITAVPLRDELFNRLVAMGGQKWESW